MINQNTSEEILTAAKNWFERSSRPDDYGIDRVSFRNKDRVVSITVKKHHQKLTLIFQPTVAGADLVILFKTAQGKIKFYDIWYRGESGDSVVTNSDVLPYMLAFWRAFTQSA